MYSLSSVLLQKIVLGLTLGIVLILCAVMTAIFSYPWKQFGIPSPLFGKMTRLYFFISLVLSVLSALLYIALIMTF